jgi:energy-coupling factor transporter ATP-binding protein EcfA2
MSTAEAPPRLRITRFYVEQIFGPESHDIDVQFDLQGRVNILYGRNGAGKTLAMAMLAELCEGRCDTFNALPARQLTLELSDQSVLLVRRDATGSPVGTLRRGEQVEWDTPLLNADTVLQELPRRFRQGLETQGTRLRGGLWLDRRDGSVVSLPVFFGRVFSGLRWDEWHRRHALEHHLPSLIDRLPTVRLVRTDRLYLRAHAIPNDGEPEAAEPQLMVAHLSRQLGSVLQQADQAYRKRSTELDATLPRRLFSKEQVIHDLEALKLRADRLAKTEDNLAELGLLRERPEPLSTDSLSDQDLRTFAIILGDREQKLQPFAVLGQKARLLLDSINKKLAPKEVRLDLEAGYSLWSAAGEALELSCLSSGEQHELVLLHELLFEVEPGTLVLIDEPELSLHVTWQQDLVADITRIARANQIDFVLATHSPYIAGDADEGGPNLVRLGPPA